MQLVCTLLHSGDLGEPMVEILELLVVVAEKKKKVRGTPYVFFDPDRAQMFPYLCTVRVKKDVRGTPYLFFFSPTITKSSNISFIGSPKSPECSKVQTSCIGPS